MVKRVSLNGYHRNYTLFDLSFLILYFLEQVLLIYFLFSYPKYMAVTIGLFVLTIITTISIQKILLDSRTKAIKEAYSELEGSYNVLLNEYGHVSLELEETSDILFGESGRMEGFKKGEK